MVCSTGVITNVGGDFSDIVSLTYCSDGPVIFGLSKANGGTLIGIDPATADSGQLGASGLLGNIKAIAWGQDVTSLFGYTPEGGGYFYSINIETAVPTQILWGRSAGLSGLGGYQMMEYLGSGNFILLRKGGVFAAVSGGDGSIITEGTLYKGARGISRGGDLGTGKSFYLFPKQVYLTNDDETPAVVVATAGLGSFRAMAYSGLVDDKLYFVG